MKRLLGIVVGLVVVAVLVTLAVGRLLPSQPVYSVADVQTGLQQHPGQWVGRTIIVRGTSLGGGSQSSCPLVVSPTPASSSLPCPQSRWVALGPPGSTAPVPLAPLVLLANHGSLTITSSISRVLSSQSGQTFRGVAWSIRPLVPVHTRLPVIPQGPGRLAGRVSQSWYTISPISSNGGGFFGSASTPQLVVALPAGAQPPVFRPHRPLPDFLYNLPLVGQPLSHLFPWDNGATVRIRINKAGLCAGTTAFAGTSCQDAVLLPS